MCWPQSTSDAMRADGNQDVTLADGSPGLHESGDGGERWTGDAVGEASCVVWEKDGYESRSAVL